MIELSDRFGPSIHKLRLKKRFCNPSCSAKARKTAKHDRWQEAEIVFIEKLIGKYTLNQIADKAKGFCRKNNFQERSTAAIKQKCVRIAKSKKISSTPFKDNWTMSKLAEILGVPFDRVRSWHRKQLIEPIFVDRCNRISRKSFKLFASKCPEKLVGIEPKRLRKVLRDKPLVDAIIRLSKYAPKEGRAMTIIRLDNGEIYPSAKKAATAIHLEMKCSEATAKTNILTVAKRNTPMQNGMDFWQLDYPLFWVPSECRIEFNFLAGKLLFSLYQDICAVVGYQKQDCLTVAARLAVDITLLSFRIKERRIFFDSPRKDQAKEAIAAYYQKKLFQSLTKFYYYSPNQYISKIDWIIKRTSDRWFWAIAGDRFLVESYSQEFVNFYIARQRKRYLKKSFLPRNYTPKTRIENADLWSYIYGSLYAHMNLGKAENNTIKRVSLISLELMHFCKQKKLDKEEKRESCRFVDGLHDKQAQQETSSSAGEEIDSLLANAKDIYDEQTYDRLSLLVALKLEEASNTEIAATMEIEVSDIPGLFKKLQACA